jgi:hypothetical protein
MYLSLPILKYPFYNAAGPLLCVVRSCPVRLEDIGEPVLPLGIDA